MSKMEKNIIIGACLVLVLVVVLLTSYAYFAQSEIQEDNNALGTGCFALTFVENTEAIELNDQFPITDTDGLATDPYNFTIKNICNYDAAYNVTLEVKNTSTITSSSIRAAIDNNHKILTSYDPTTPTLTNYTSSYILKTGNLKQGEEVTYDLRLWLDSAAPETAMNKEFISKIVIVATALKTTNPTLGDLILAQYGGKDAIEEAPANTFTSTSNASTNMMYKMEDDYGMSYYYRGAKDLLNNNLIFAEHQWKIVRINGDGSVRIIYNGTCPNNSCTINNTENSTAKETEINYIYFNQFYSDEKYVGYMYGGEAGVASTSRAEAVTNETSSNAKIELESWYTTNIENNGYASYISDTLFCNDRRLQNEVGGPAGGPGYGHGEEETIYAAYHRLITNKNPMLLCGNKNDKFTVNDTVNGNGDLSKAIGLLTADELILAGADLMGGNESYYLYTNGNSWTLTPAAGYYPYMFHQQGENLFSSGEFGELGLHGVLNLNSNTMVTGTGSETDPFVVI